MEVYDINLVVGSTEVTPKDDLNILEIKELSLRNKSS